MFRKPYVVGVVGGSASGKSSFLRDLVARLPERSCCVLSLDNYYRPLAEQTRDAAGEPNFDLPGAIDRDQFIQDLAALLRGEAVARRQYMFNHTDRKGELITYVPANILLLEGLFLFHDEEIRAMLDLLVFIDADPGVCKNRRLQRDLHERGYPAEHVEYHWHHHVLPAYEEFIRPYREHAHIVVFNDLSYEQGLDRVVLELKYAL